ncbi:MAG: hypothetical protein KF869_05975 [Phycisphaeraceae bacterium]|nr:hypothetical protein [Phycisphaeraceae bacterium]
MAALADPAGDSAQRTAAASRVLASSDPQSRLAAVALLAPGGMADAQRLLLDRAAELSNAPAWLVGPCRGLIEAPGSPAQVRLAAVNALASVRSRDSVRVLIALLDAGERPELREPAARALLRLTGRAELATDARRWREWFASVEWLPDAEWRSVLAHGLAEAADRAARERDRSVALLVDALRANFQDSDKPEQRSAMLFRFLQHEMAAVRRLGLQLARQEVANARSLDANVVRATEALLTDSSREFRRAAAELLATLPRLDIADAVANALIREEDPEVAAPLLRAAARNPTPAITASVMRWVEGPELCRGPALNAAAALYAEGDLSDPAAFVTLRRVLRDAPLSDLSPGPNGTLALYYALGGTAERSRVRALLDHDDPNLRLSAADLLSSDADATDALIAAAQRDPRLLGAVARAVATHRPTFDGFDAVRQLRAESVTVHREALLEVAAQMPPQDLLAAALVVEDPVFREALLSRLTATDELQTFGIWRIRAQTPNPSVIAGLLLLCRTRLELGRPAAAMEVLTDLEPVWMLIEPGEREHLRTVTLLWLNRIEEASQCGGSIVDWLDGLERAIHLPHAPAIVRAMETRFTPINGEAADRLRLLRGMIPGGG